MKWWHLFFVEGHIQFKVFTDIQVIRINAGSTKVIHINVRYFKVVCFDAEFEFAVASIYFDR